MTEEQAKTGRVFTMRSPLWGLCKLLPQDGEPGGKTCIGYVAFEGNPDNLNLAIWDGKRWCNRSFKPVLRPIAKWYKVFKADGTPALS